MDTIPWDQADEDASFGIPAELAPRRYWYAVALDNHEPVRHIADGIIVRHWQRPRREGEHPTPQADAWHISQWARLDDMGRAIYLIDNGRTVTPYWPAGSGNGEPSPLYPEGREPYVLLHPFPTSSILDARDGQPANFESWMLGPRRAYHLKIRRVLPNIPAA